MATPEIITTPNISVIDELLSHPFDLPNIFFQAAQTYAITHDFLRISDNKRNIVVFQKEIDLQNNNVQITRMEEYRDGHINVVLKDPQDGKEVCVGIGGSDFVTIIYPKTEEQKSDAKFFHLSMLYKLETEDPKANEILYAVVSILFP